MHYFLLSILTRTKEKIFQGLLCLTYLVKYFGYLFGLVISFVASHCNDGTQTGITWLHEYMITTFTLHYYTPSAEKRLFIKAFDNLIYE